MKAYLSALLITVLACSVAGILLPQGETGRYARLASGLVFICVLVSPLSDLIGSLGELADGTWQLPGVELESEALKAEMDAVLDEASEVYFANLLTQALCRQFEIGADEVRCSVLWERDPEPTPRTVRVILSGKAKWKDPHAVEAFVVELLNCECLVAIE